MISDNEVVAEVKGDQFRLINGIDVGDFFDLLQYGVQRKSERQWPKGISLLDPFRVVDFVPTA